ncbi:MAG: hypothetical protein MUO50_19205 [Longimicrobiales bacterium]|nr:hypothetical protein [Longimicrobiales bacterium]
MKIDEGPGDEAAWVGSIGAALTFRSSRLPLGLRLEYGRYAAPSKFFDMQDQVLREFHVSRPMLQLTLSR